MTKAETILNKLAGIPGLVGESIIKAVKTREATALNTTGEKLTQVLTEHKALSQFGVSKAQELGLNHQAIVNLKTGPFNLNTKLQERTKLAKHFVEQHHPKKVKEIYKALKREHPEYSAKKKAMIANSTYDKMK